MQPSDIGALVAAGTPRVSPGGDLVAFVVTRVDGDANCYRGQIWLVPSDGSRPAEPFTSGEHRDGNPAWSPDGRRLAFTSTRAGDDRTSLHLAPVAAGGETVTLAAFDESVSDLCWSPDGRYVALTSRVRDAGYEITDPKRKPPRRITHFFNRLDGVGWVHDRPKHVHLVAVDGSAPPLDVTPGEHEFRSPAWSPDGSRLVFAGASHDTWDLDAVTDLFVWSAAAGGPARITRSDGAYDHPSWSPDGTRIALLGYDEPTKDPQNTHLGIVAAGGGAVAWIGRSLDRTLAPFGGTRTPVWDGEDVLVPADDRGNVHLYRMSATDAFAPELLIGGERSVTDFDLADGTLAFTATTIDRPGEIFAVTSAGEERRTTVTDAFVARARPVAADRFTAPSSGGADVDVWVFLPPGFDPGARYPALLNIHGGPFTQYGNRFFDEAQVQAAAGYVVVLSNPRGSSGREESWARAIVGPKAAHDPGTSWGSVDYDDVMAAMDETLRRYPAIDPDRLGVIGGSYGGYMTTWVVAHTNRFKAACSERAVNDMTLEESAADIASGFRFNFGPTWFEDPEEYRRISPITYVRDIDTPMLILHSEDDLRCPIAGAEQLFVALRLMGKEVEFYRFPAEGHELSRSGSPVHRIQRAELILDWFARHLQCS